MNLVSHRVFFCNNQMIYSHLACIVIQTYRILVNIFAFGFIICSITNHALIIGALKNIPANLLITKPFKRGNDMRHHFIRRGRRPLYSAV